MATYYVCMAKTTQLNVDLEDDYYLVNFEKVLLFIEETYLDLLRRKEMSFLKTFKACSINAKRLFVRLSLRQKSFFRFSKLNYPEINLDEGLEECNRNGLIELNPALQYPDILEPFTVKEIKDFYQLHSADKNAKKRIPSKRSNLIEACRPFEDKVDGWIKEKDTLIWPLHDETLERFQLLFFGNLYGHFSQDMAQFIFEDIGIMKFEKITIDKSNRYFSSRDHLNAHYRWSCLHGELWEAIEDKDCERTEVILKDLKKINYKGESLKRRLSRSYNLLAKFYESCNRKEEALKLYESSIKEPARERRVRLLEKFNRDQEAFNLCSEIQSRPNSENERYFATFFIEKIKKKLGKNYTKRKKLPTVPEVILPLKWEKKGRVESQVLSYLEEEKFKGFFCENSYWGTLAALLFWDEFWSPASGVFYHPFENGPRDFYTGEFYRREQDRIQERKIWWENQKDWWPLLEKRFDEKFLTHCTLTSWKRVKKENLKQLVSVASPEIIFDITLQILKDPKQYRSGLPDLFLEGPQGEIILGEVKSPNDQIQTSQKRWFDFFLLKEIPFKIYRLKS